MEEKKKDHFDTNTSCKVGTYQASRYLTSPTLPYAYFAPQPHAVISASQSMLEYLILAASFNVHLANAKGLAIKDNI